MALGFTAEPGGTEIQAQVPRSTIPFSIEVAEKDGMRVRRQKVRNTSKGLPEDPLPSPQTVLSWQGDGKMNGSWSHPPPLGGATAQVSREVRSQPPHGGT